MLKKVKLLFPIFISMLIILCVLWAQAGPKMTAKEALGKAREKAQAWQADAVLYQISALGVGDDGRLTESTSSYWMYYFYSARTMQTYTVTVTDSVAGFEGAGNFRKAIEGDFVDSDKVMAEVKKNGFKPQGDISIFLAYDWVKPLGKMAFAWYVCDSKDPKSTRYYVDYKSGAFLGTSQ